ncbi:hypothetical protein ACFL96_08855 [Thermoproteota archaeon]
MKKTISVNSEIGVSEEDQIQGVVVKFQKKFGETEIKSILGKYCDAGYLKIDHTFREKVIELSKGLYDLCQRVEKRSGQKDVQELIARINKLGFRGNPESLLGMFDLLGDAVNELPQDAFTEYYGFLFMVFALSLDDCAETVTNLADLQTIILPCLKKIPTRILMSYLNSLAIGKSPLLTDYLYRLPLILDFISDSVPIIEKDDANFRESFLRFVKNIINRNIELMNREKQAELSQLLSDSKVFISTFIECNKKNSRRFLAGKLFSSYCPLLSRRMELIKPENQRITEIILTNVYEPKTMKQYTDLRYLNSEFLLHTDPMHLFEELISYLVRINPEVTIVDETIIQRLIDNFFDKYYKLLAVICCGTQQSRHAIQGSQLLAKELRAAFARSMDRSSDGDAAAQDLLGEMSRFIAPQMAGMAENVGKSLAGLASFSSKLKNGDRGDIYKRILGDQEGGGYINYLEKSAFHSILGSLINVEYCFRLFRDDHLFDLMIERLENSADPKALFTAVIQPMLRHFPDLFCKEKVSGESFPLLETSEKVFRAFETELEQLSEGKDCDRKEILFEANYILWLKKYPDFLYSLRSSAINEHVQGLGVMIIRLSLICPQVSERLFNRMYRLDSALFDLGNMQFINNLLQFLGMISERWESFDDPKKVDDFLSSACLCIVEDNASLFSNIKDNRDNILNLFALLYKLIGVIKDNEWLKAEYELLMSTLFKFNFGLIPLTFENMREIQRLFTDIKEPSHIAVILSAFQSRYCLGEINEAIAFSRAGKPIPNRTFSDKSVPEQRRVLIYIKVFRESLAAQFLHKIIRESSVYSQEVIILALQALTALGRDYLPEDATKETLYSFISQPKTSSLIKAEAVRAYWALDWDSENGKFKELLTNEIMKIEKDEEAYLLSLLETLVHFPFNTQTDKKLSTKLVQLSNSGSIDIKEACACVLCKIPDLGALKKAFSIVFSRAWPYPDTAEQGNRGHFLMFVAGSRSLERAKDMMLYRIKQSLSQMNLEVNETQPADESLPENETLSADAQKNTLSVLRKNLAAFLTNLREATRFIHFPLAIPEKGVVLRALGERAGADKPVKALCSCLALGSGPADLIGAKADGQNFSKAWQFYTSHLLDFVLNPFYYSIFAPMLIIDPHRVLESRVELEGRSFNVVYSKRIPLNAIPVILIHESYKEDLYLIAQSMDEQKTIKSRLKTRLNTLFLMQIRELKFWLNRTIAGQKVFDKIIFVNEGQTLSQEIPRIIQNRGHRMVSREEIIEASTKNGLRLEASWDAWSKEFVTTESIKKWLIDDDAYFQENFARMTTALPLEVRSQAWLDNTHGKHKDGTPISVWSHVRGLFLGIGGYGLVTNGLRLSKTSGLKIEKIRILLRLAGLMHDIGKIETKASDHPLKSVEISERLLKNEFSFLDLSEADHSLILSLVKNNDIYGRFLTGRVFFTEFIKILSDETDKLSAQGCKLTQRDFALLLFCLFLPDASTLVSVKNNFERYFDSLGLPDKEKGRVGKIAALLEREKQSFEAFSWLKTLRERYWVS